jgi:hypothetical protein
MSTDTVATLRDTIPTTAERLLSAAKEMEDTGWAEKALPLIEAAGLIRRIQAGEVASAIEAHRKVPRARRAPAAGHWLLRSPAKRSARGAGGVPQRRAGVRAAPRHLGSVGRVPRKEA